MSSPALPSARPGGLATTLRAAVNAGLMSGMLFGLADGAVAGMATHPGGVLAWLGCLGLAVLTYGIVWTAVMLAVSFPLHPFLRARDQQGRFRILATLAVGLGLFLELYWWTRPYLYSGLSAFDPRRLALAAGFLLAALALAALLARAARVLPGALRIAATVSVPLFWLAGGVYFFSLSSETAERGASSPRNRDLPNVLLIVVDALRADMLGAYGNQRVKTPVLDELAARGVLFENAIVTAPFTWASFGSILTGKYPRRHGLVKIDPLVRMRTDNVTLPWHLKSAVRTEGGVALQPEDFLSGTFMTGTLSHGSGLARGFDVYYEALVGHDIVDTASPWSVFRSQLVLSILRDKLQQSFDSSRVITVARDWFAEQRGKRTMAMVHLYSTHTPYDPPQHFREQYCDPKYAGPAHAFYAGDRLAIESGRYTPTEADRRQIRNLYEAGVAQADAMIGELLADLRTSGTLDETLVIVTADHGEELGDHDLWEHNWPFQTNLRVPLILSFPKLLPEGRRIAEGVQSIDLLPTILDAMKLALPEEATLPDPRGHIDGASLMPLIRGESVAVRPFAFSETNYFMSVQDTAAKGPRYKLIVATGGDCAASLSSTASGSVPPQLYRLDVDPSERQNLLKSEPREAQRLLDALCAWDASMPIAQFQVLDSDRDTRDREVLLEVLGYASKAHEVEPPKKPR